MRQFGHLTAVAWTETNLMTRQTPKTFKVLSSSNKQIVGCEVSETHSTHSTVMDDALLIHNFQYWQKKEEQGW